jgi:hypothetical protein
MLATSHTRITAVMNRNTQGVPVDLLPRIPARLDYRVKISFLVRGGLKVGRRAPVLTVEANVPRPLPRQAVP